MPLRIAGFLVLCAILVFFLQREQDRGTLHQFERLFVDWLIGNHAESIREPAITFVRLDEVEKEIFETWPLNQLDYAVVLKNLEKYQPGVIMVAPVLKWKQEDEIGLSVLRTRILRVPQVLLGCVIENNPVPTQDGEETPLPASAKLPVLKNIEGDLLEIPSFTGFAALPEAGLLPGTEIGFTQFDLPGTGGAGALRVPLLARRGEEVVASFVLQALLTQHGASPSDVRVTLGEAIRIEGPSLSIPIDRAGNLTVFGGLRHRLPKLNAGALLLAREPGIDLSALQDEPPIALDTLEKNIVLVGEDHADARRIPLDNQTNISQAELLALAIATIQTDQHISRWPQTWQFSLWGGLVLLGLFVIRLPRRRAVMLGLLLLLFFVVGSLLLFQSTLTWAPPQVPLAIIGLTLVIGLLFGGENKKSEAAETASHQSSESKA